MLQGMLGDDTMSNLTSASNEEIYTNNDIYHESSFAPPAKKKRNLPGNPDPEAEVVAISPKTLMATNRFVCEICNKGFQRDQNLQLHRRGHNLPWKLKQRNKLEIVKKKVYVCPEPSCVHHHPSRALGDLTGIKKHFSRKHGEKKWKCEKCSKRYAVQSDWKAHSKICGTREYRCDCGTLFSRRDSFITHRAFCDALAEESSRSNPLILSSQTGPSNQNQIHAFQFHQNHHFVPLLKQENQNFNIPPWLLSSDPGAAAGPGPPTNQLFTLPSGIEPSIQELPGNPNNNNQISINALGSNSSSSSVMSATALLQKAAQMGVTMSTKLASGSMHYNNNNNNNNNNNHMGAGALGFCATTAGLPTREEFVHGLASFGDKVVMDLQDMNNNVVGSNTLPCSTSGFMSGSPGFDDSFNGMFNTKRNTGSNFQENAHFMSLNKEGSGGGGGAGGGEGLTRDFLGLRAFSHRDFLNMAVLDQLGSSSYDQQAQNQTQWHSH